MKVTNISTVTGGQAIDLALEGKTLYFPDGFGMKGLIYDDTVFSYFFVNYDDQLIRTNWSDGHIANRTWEVER